MNPYEFIMDGDYEMNPIVSKVKTMAFWWIMKKQKKKGFNVFWVKEEGLTFFENKNNYFFSFWVIWKQRDVGWSHLTPKAVAG